MNQPRPLCISFHLESYPSQTKLLSAAAMVAPLDPPANFAQSKSYGDWQIDFVLKMYAKYCKVRYMIVYLCIYLLCMYCMLMLIEFY